VATLEPNAGSIDELMQQIELEQASRRKEIARKATETRRQRREEERLAIQKRKYGYQALHPAKREALEEKLRVACTEYDGRERYSPRSSRDSPI
jgi:hypothetical protein